MKKLLAFTLATTMLLSLFTGCSGQGATTESTSGDVIKIGVFEPASGDNGAGGKQETLGIQYANYKTPTVDIGGKTYNVQLEIVDNQSTAAYAPTAAQELISKGVSVVLGSYGSAICIAASDVFKDAGVPAISVTATNPAVTADNDHYFRICFLDPFQGTVLANFAKDELGAKKAYVLAKLGDDYSVGLSNYFMEAFGAENCVYETFPEGTSDYSSYVASAKAAGADVFFSPTSTEAAALIIDQANTQGLTTPILAGDTWDSNVITNAAKGKNVQVYITTFYQEGANAEFDSGIKEWINSDSTAKANNGGDDKISALTAMGYDAYYTALEAIKAAGDGDPVKVMAALPGVNYQGVTGPIKFDEIGDAVRDKAFVKHCNTETGDWEFVAEQGVN
ncbi:MAG: ABC transporter substrate-binding protein [Clostridiales bacterium]|jgi:branched-chain amino acid transport system substrate-binding protein|nr:ABC transporter substrate-binding protein [Clostridiales bacterium]